MLTFFSCFSHVDNVVDCGGPCYILLCFKRLIGSTLPNTTISHFKLVTNVMTLTYNFQTEIKKSKKGSKLHETRHWRNLTFVYIIF